MSATRVFRVRPGATSTGSCARAPVARSDIAVLPEEGRDEALARDLRAVEFLEQLLLAEHEDAVHELDVLVELGREHDDRESLARERAEECVQVVLRPDVDTAGRV